MRRVRVHAPTRVCAPQLDGVPALERLQHLAQTSDERIRKLLLRALLVGLDQSGGGGDGTVADSPRGGDLSLDASSAAAASDDDADYLIRTVLGVDKAGGIFVGDSVTPGVTRLRFHVRDATAGTAHGVQPNAPRMRC
jgi:small ligand-binding sensory domain FIST